MTTQPNTDRKLSAYFITTALVLGFTVLPWYSEIANSIKGDKAQVEIVEEPVHYTDMSQADIVVVNVDDLDVVDGFLFYHTNLVESDLDEQTLAELLYQKEEIVIRVDGDKFGIISGDNGQF